MINLAVLVAYGFLGLVVVFSAYSLYILIAADWEQE